MAMGWRREEFGATHACMMNERGLRGANWLGGVDSVVARLGGGGLAGPGGLRFCDG